MNRWASICCVLAALAAGTVLWSGLGDDKTQSFLESSIKRLDSSYVARLPVIGHTLIFRLEVHKTALLQAIKPLDWFKELHIRSKLYAVCAICSPRLALWWGWVADYDNTHMLFSPAPMAKSAVLQSGRALAGIFAWLPSQDGFLDSPLQLVEDSGSATGTLLYWLCWLLCPGLQVWQICLTACAIGTVHHQLHTKETACCSCQMYGALFLLVWPGV